jgi:hypothetical protein
MKNAERYRRSAEVDRRDHGITRCSDDRYGIVKLVRDVGLAAVRRKCDADGAVANGDRRGHSVPNLLHNIVYLTNLCGGTICPMAHLSGAIGLRHSRDGGGNLSFADCAVENVLQACTKGAANAELSYHCCGEDDPERSEVRYMRVSSAYWSLLPTY